MDFIDEVFELAGKKEDGSCQIEYEIKQNVRFPDIFIAYFLRLNEVLKN